MVQQTIAPPLVRGQWVPMTWDEFLAWAPPEGRAEWVNGWGIADVSTSIRHGDFLNFFSSLLGLYVRLFGLGRMYTSDSLMRLPTRPSGREPDIMVILTDHLDRLGQRWFEGPADFVVEFVSEDDPDRDLVEKFQEYERAGVREYLTVDARPDRHEVRFHRLDADGRFQPVDPDERGRCHLATLPGLWFDPAWFTQDPLPDPLRLMKLIAPQRLRQVLFEESESEP